MILPIGDSPNPEGTPLVTYLLVAANVAVYLLTLPLAWSGADVNDPLLNEYLHLVARQTGYKIAIPELLSRVSAYDLLIYRWGYKPVDPSLLDLFASMFLHGGFAHLAGNMLFLWIYGDNVEHRLGHARFLFYYLLAGAAATLFHAMFAPDSGLPLVGASGAISGVLGFYFLWFPRNQVHLLLLFPFLLRMTISARTLLGIYIVFENIFPFLISRGGGGVAHGAHIGGFLAGIGVAYWFNHGETQRGPAEYSSKRPTRDGRDSIQNSIAEGNFARAATAYFEIAPESTKGILNPNESIELGNWLLENGHAQAALVVFRRHIRDHPAGPETAAAHLGAGEAQLRHLGQTTAAYQHFLDALEGKPSAATAARARAALAEISDRQNPMRRPRFN